MSKQEMVDCMNELLSYVDKMGEQDSTGSAMNEIKILRMMLKYTRMFVSWATKMRVESLFPVFQRIQDFIEVSTSELRVLSTDTSTLMVSEMLRTICLFKSDLQQQYFLEKPALSTPIRHEFVIEFINHALECLKDLLRFSYMDNSSFPLQHLVQELVKALMIWRSLVRFISSIRGDEDANVSTFFRTIETEVRRVVIEAYNYFPEEMNEVREYQMYYMLEIIQRSIDPTGEYLGGVFFSALRASTLADEYSNTPNTTTEIAVTVLISSIKALLKDLSGISELKFRWKGMMRDKIENFHDDLDFLHIFVVDLPVQISLQDIDGFQQIREVTFAAGVVVSLMNDEVTMEEDDSKAEELNQALVEFEDKLEQFLSSLSARQDQLKLPKTVQSFLSKNNNSIGYVNFRLDNLEEMLSCYSDSVDVVKDLFLLALKYLKVLQPSVRDDRSTDFAALVSGKAHELEYIIDSLVIGEVPVSCLKLWLWEITKEIKQIKADTEENKTDDHIMTTSEVSESQMASKKSDDSPKTNKAMVGFEDAIKTLRKQLIEGSSNQEVISIVGMPGLGKTTLANKLYADDSVVLHFEFRATCCVSQVYTRKDLLVDLLTDVTQPSELSKLAEDQLADKLQKYLKTKRYLLMLDDVWETGVWDDLYSCFPDTGNGSRILLTTRLDKVAECEGFLPHHLRQFRDDESWTLLKETVFQDDTSCSPDLEVVGQEIAKKCGGLPLLVVLVAGILAKPDKKVEDWKKVSRSLSSSIKGDSTRSMDIIEFSYKELPNHLKPCFLYFGAFLEDKEISVSKLIWLWIAEGFVAETKHKVLEDIAELYMNDLIGRNLVFATKRRSMGGVKSCRIHDLLRSFCLEKAKECNYLLWIYGDHDPDSLHSFCEKTNHRRLSIYSTREALDAWSPSTSHVRSLLFTEDRTKELSLQRCHLLSIFGKFKFLRVLDLEGITVYSFPTQLILLRYLSLQFASESIPSSVENLNNLETIVVQGIRPELQLPNTFWNMVKLRHVCIKDRATFDLCNSSSSVLNDLETLSTPLFTSKMDVESVMRRTPNLRKLKCVVSGTWRYSKKLRNFCSVFPRFDLLTQLESLKLLCHWPPERYPCDFDFPSTLRKLTLSGFRLPWTEISTIAMLERLEVLKLQHYAFFWRPWEVKDGQFPRLKMLQLKYMQIDEWIVSEDDDNCFPMLERLVMESCYVPNGLPSCFGDMTSLKSIELRWCSSCIESAMDIRDTQIDLMQNNDFKLSIFSSPELMS